MEDSEARIAAQRHRAATTGLPHTMKALQSDSFVEIYVGEMEKPLLVQKLLLQEVSEYFREAIDSYTGAQPVILRFPDDEFYAWEEMLRWIFTRLPVNHSSSNSMIEAWTLGQKYGLAEFQDGLMVDLMGFIEEVDPPTDEVRAAFEYTEPGSKIRELYAEEVVKLLHACYDKTSRYDVTPEDIHAEIDYERCGRFSGFIAALMEVDRCFRADGAGFFNRFKKREGVKEARWKHFLAGDGKRVHYRGED